MGQGIEVTQNNKQKLTCISKEYYEYLRNKALLMEVLEGHGVDNWDGYGDAYGDFLTEKEEFK